MGSEGDYVYLGETRRARVETRPANWHGSATTRSYPSPRDQKLGRLELFGPQTPSAACSSMDIRRRSHYSMRSPRASATGTGGPWWTAAAYATQTYMDKEPSAHTARLPTIKRYGSSQAETRASHTDAGIRVLGRLSYVVPLGIPPPAVYWGPWIVQLPWAREGMFLCSSRCQGAHADRVVTDYLRTWKQKDVSWTGFRGECSRER